MVGSFIHGIGQPRRSPARPTVPLAPDTERLVLRAQRGDVEAFAALVRAHDGVVRAVVDRMVRDADDAEDMAQEAWLRVAESLGQVTYPDRFAGWLRRIARNVCLNFLRSDQRRPRSPHSADDTDGTALVPDDASAGPETHLLLRDDQRKVWETIGALSEGDQLVLRLRLLEGKGYAEIGRVLKTSSHAAEVRGARARDRFRRRFAAVDGATGSCPVNPLQLRALLEGTSREDGSLGRHVAMCVACQERLTTMRRGSTIFGSFGLVFLAASDALSIGSKVAAKLRGVLGAIGGRFESGVSALSRVPSTSLPSEIASGATSLVTGPAAGLAVATTVLSMAVTFGVAPAQAHDLDGASAVLTCEDTLVPEHAEWIGTDVASHAPEPAPVSDSVLLAEPSAPPAPPEPESTAPARLALPPAASTPAPHVAPPATEPPAATTTPPERGRPAHAATAQGKTPAPSGPPGQANAAGSKIITEPNRVPNSTRPPYERESESSERESREGERDARDGIANAPSKATSANSEITHKSEDRGTSEKDREHRDTAAKEREHALERTAARAPASPQPRA